MVAARITWLVVTFVPESARVPLPEAGSVTICTLESASPSVSEKLKFAAENV